MTEAEWLWATAPTAMTGPSAMLGYLGKASERKLRLFACACVRRQWPLVPPVERSAVDVAERFADGQATGKELKDARFQCRMQPYFSGGVAAYKCASPTATHAARLAEEWARHSLMRYRLDTNDPDPNRTHQEERTAHAELIRDIFGNPFRPVAVVPSWLSSTVVSLAEGIYQDRAFDRLPLLADALQDAGCDNSDVLGHCRSGEPHVRGCWVVDLLTGRT